MTKRMTKLTHGRPQLYHRLAGVSGGASGTRARSPSGTWHGCHAVPLVAEGPDRPEGVHDPVAVEPVVVHRAFAGVSGGDRLPGGQVAGVGEVTRLGTGVPGGGEPQYRLGDPRGQPVAAAVADAESADD